MGVKEYFKWKVRDLSKKFSRIKILLVTMGLIVKKLKNL